MDKVAGGFPPRSKLATIKTTDGLLSANQLKGCVFMLRERLKLLRASPAFSVISSDSDLQAKTGMTLKMGIVAFFMFIATVATVNLASPAITLVLFTLTFAFATMILMDKAQALTFTVGFVTQLFQSTIIKMTATLKAEILFVLTLISITALTLTLFTGGFSAAAITAFAILALIGAAVIVVLSALEAKTALFGLPTLTWAAEQHQKTTTTSHSLIANRRSSATAGYPFAIAA